jgi:alanine racemase
MRPTRAEISLQAIAHNVAHLAAVAAPAQIMAVVKADGYGHGAVPVARAALDAGVAALGVAMVEEGMELRDAGIDAPVLVLSEAHPCSLDALVTAGLAATVYSEAAVDSLGAAAQAAAATVDVHLKIDTGMHRVGCEPAAAPALARRVTETVGLNLAACFTHLAVADAPQDPTTVVQLDAFDAVVAELEAAGLRPPVLHAANSAGALAHPRSRLDLVRCGIACYGVAPGPEVADAAPLQPAMRLVSEVSFVKSVPAGTRVSYGLNYACPVDTVLATVPAGYADGVPRRLGSVGGEVLVGGRRVPVAGSVTMDQFVVDCGPDARVAVGDEVVLLGTQGDEVVTAEQWAEALGTIGYEIVTRISTRVPRLYVG